ncbi:NAD(+)--rifampin ADP-ribosyltransferase [Phycicoccus flavus]|uniref:NAD(+)--rifampin ADP-ribosyltransferase n=1 Tax=Phycicoccus flavus TaxID=2502783 RepID=UPI000FEB88A1|nr:NAD(+)--rifampin ADP-ribosyltransferase [Phycicoccus flavus]NHA68074.1 NAD(+)--rifampin ADP-ribosyltransferase [Phycicoccus flavus]
MQEPSSDHPRVTYDSCDGIGGPFYHGTAALLEPGAELVPGHRSNVETTRVMNHVYFTSLVATAAWGAQLAAALRGREDRGHVYVVEPTGPFEDDPNVTDKRFPGNPTRSFRARTPLRVVSELRDWEAHSPEALATMLDSLSRLREQGLAVIED